MIRDDFVGKLNDVIIGIFDMGYFSNVHVCVVFVGGVR